MSCPAGFNLILYNCDTERDYERRCMTALGFGFLKGHVFLQEHESRVMKQRRAAAETHMASIAFYLLPVIIFFPHWTCRGTSLTAAWYRWAFSVYMVLYCLLLDKLWYELDPFFHQTLIFVDETLTR